MAETERLSRLHRFVRKQKNGWGMTMHVVELPGGELLIHSPTFIDDDTYTAIEKLGRPRWLFAPNHFHHLGLRRYRERFPEAVPVASAGALPRLRKQGHLDLVPLEQAPLPEGVRWLAPEGTKSGETWLSFDTAAGRTWLVCDAFFHQREPVSGFTGSLLRVLRIQPGLCLGATYKFVCLRDRPGYRDWALAALEREQPTNVHFSHGSPLETDVVPALAALLRARL